MHDLTFQLKPAWTVVQTICFLALGQHELAVRRPDILKSTAKAAFEMLGKEGYYVDTATAHLLR